MSPLPSYLSLLLFINLLAGTSLAASDWKFNKSQHFIVYYKNAPQDFVKTVEEMAETYYDEISDNLGFTRYGSWSWDDRAKIYIYDHSEDYISEGRQMNWSHGSASPGDKIIRTFPSAHGFFDSTLPHELGHIIFREVVGINARMPHWFDEGVAMYQEKAKRFGANQMVRQAISQKTFIPLKELGSTYLTSQSGQPLIDLFYAESASIVYYMINELGEQRFVRMCGELKKGQPFEWALKNAYVRFRALEDLNKAWINYLQP